MKSKEIIYGPERNQIFLILKQRWCLWYNRKAAVNLRIEENRRILLKRDQKWIQKYKKGLCYSFSKMLSTIFDPYKLFQVLLEKIIILSTWYLTLNIIWLCLISKNLSKKFFFDVFFKKNRLKFKNRTRSLIVIIFLFLEVLLL